MADQDPAQYLPKIRYPDLSDNWPVQANAPVINQPLTGPAKYAGQFTRGASLGFIGDPEGPENIPQMLTEGAGMTLPFVLGTKLAVPLIAAAGMRGAGAVATRMMAGGLTGAVQGATHAANTQGDPLMEGIMGGVLGAVGEGAWTKWMRGTGRSSPEQNVGLVKDRALSLPPGIPPGMAGNPLVLKAYPIHPRRGAQRALPEAEPLALPAHEGPTLPPPTTTPSGRRTIPNERLGDVFGIEMEGAPGAAPAASQIIPEVVTPIPMPEGFRPPTAWSAQQIRLLKDEGATQLVLPMDIKPSTRLQRYVTPTRYKGIYETPRLAAIESDMAAAAAAREGATSIRVTTTVGGRTGLPTGGLLRVYEAAPGAAPVLIKEVPLNMTATKAASVGASPMRRVSPDHFTIEYNEQLRADVMTPASKEVETALTMASAIDPRQTTLPLSPQQLTFLESFEGRSVRQALDIRTKHVTAEQVMRMSDDEAKKVLLGDVVEAPPTLTTAIIEPTESAVKAQATLASLGITENEVNEFLKRLPHIPKNVRSQELLKWLQSKCIGAA